VVNYQPSNAKTEEKSSAFQALSVAFSSPVSTVRKNISKCPQHTASQPSARPPPRYRLIPTRTLSSSNALLLSATSNGCTWPQTDVKHTAEPERTLTATSCTEPQAVHWDRHMMLPFTKARVAHIQLANCDNVAAEPIMAATHVHESPRRLPADSGACFPVVHHSDESIEVVCVQFALSGVATYTAPARPRAPSLLPRIIRCTAAASLAASPGLRPADARHRWPRDAPIVCPYSTTSPWQGWYGSGTPRYICMPGVPPATGAAATALGPAQRCRLRPRRGPSTSPQTSPCWTCPEPTPEL
jgi:hypothetical protein